MELKEQISKLIKEKNDNYIIEENNLVQIKDENHILNNTIVSLKHELQTQEEKNKSMLSVKQEKITYLDHKNKEAISDLHTYISSTQKQKTLNETSKEKEKSNQIEIAGYKSEIDRLLNVIDE